MSPTNLSKYPGGSVITHLSGKIVVYFRASCKNTEYAMIGRPREPRMRGPGVILASIFRTPSPMPAADRQMPGRTTGIICTVLGGMLSLWVVARLSSVAGWQQTWAPPFVEYEWVTLVGAFVATGLLIIGLVQVTQPTVKEGTVSRGEPNQKKQSNAPSPTSADTETQA